MKVSKNSIGEYLVVRFEDHCINASDTPDEPILIEAIGKLTKVTKKFITLTTWMPVTSNEEMRYTNSERTIILQSTIIDVFFLKFIERVINEN